MSASVIIELLDRPLIRIPIALDGSIKVPLEPPRPLSGQPTSIGRVLQGQSNTYGSVWIRICRPNDPEAHWMKRVEENGPRRVEFRTEGIGVSDVLLMANELKWRHKDELASAPNKLCGIVVEKTEKQLVLVKFGHEVQAFERLRDILEVDDADLPNSDALEVLVKRTEAELNEIIARNKALVKEYANKREALFDAVMLWGRRKKRQPGEQ